MYSRISEQKVLYRIISSLNYSEIVIKCINPKMIIIFSSQDELIVYPILSTISNISSETAWPINVKFQSEPPSEGNKSLYKRSRSHDQYHRFRI